VTGWNEPKASHQTERRLLEMSVSTFVPDFDDVVVEPIGHLEQSAPLKRKEQLLQSSKMQRVLSDLSVLLLVRIKSLREQDDGKMPKLQKQ
jgi:hypothetical protein